MFDTVKPEKLEDAARCRCCGKALDAGEWAVIDGNGNTYCNGREARRWALEGLQRTRRRFAASA